jgi:glycosyltransferase involved in cell wall biosynthesis
LRVSGKLVLALFGTAHPERAWDYAEAAIAALASEHGADGLCVLNLGQCSVIPDVPPNVHVYTPGFLPNDALSLHLRASDVLLLPFTDGLSTRRGTLMAGLAHSLPVLSLQGVNTDRVLVEHTEAMVLTPCGDLDAYVREAVQLARDPARLRAIGEAGRNLYESDFDWPVLARMVLAALRMFPGS